MAKVVCVLYEDPVDGGDGAVCPSGYRSIRGIPSRAYAVG